MAYTYDKPQIWSLKHW